MLQSFTDFFSSTAGKLVTVVLLGIALLAYAGWLRRKNELSVKSLAYSAIAIACALVFSYVRIFKMPQGGSITFFSMLFITLIGYWFGSLPGILAGVSYGLLQFIIDPFVLHPVQVLFDYPLAFGALGLSGLFYKKENGLVNGYIIGVFGRFIFSFLSGMIFFGEYAPEGFSTFMYSFSYNLAYIGGEAFLTVILLLVPSFKKAIDIVGRQITA